jgi:hypothetical protein
VSQKKIWKDRILKKNTPIRKYTTFGKAALSATTAVTAAIIDFTIFILGFFLDYASLAAKIKSRLLLD